MANTSRPGARAAFAVAVGLAALAGGCARTMPYYALVTVDSAPRKAPAKHATEQAGPSVAVVQPTPR